MGAHFGGRGGDEAVSDYITRFFGTFFRLSLAKGPDFYCFLYVAKEKEKENNVRGSVLKSSPR